MKILFYGRLGDALGREMQLDDDEARSVAELRALIVNKRPEAAELLASTRVRACIGDSIVAEDHRVLADDQVEFLPPVSGG